MTRTPPWCRLALAVLLGGAWLGCGGASSARKGEGLRLQSKVAELRAQARRDRRKIRDLENRILVLKDRRARADLGEAPEEEPPGEPPALPVEVLEPEAESSAGPAAQGGEVAGVSDEGVEIVYAGDALRSDPIRLSSERYDLDGEPSPPRTRGDVPEAGDRLPIVSGDIPSVSEVRRARTPPIRSRKRAFGDPRSEYRRYYEALRRGDHAAAVSGFRNFLKRFPRHDYADNAQYWLGEAYYDQKRFRSAALEFQRVADDYPSGNKVPDALLKVGYCRARLGDMPGARVALRRVIDRYPRSNPAALAARKLKQLEE